MLSTVRMRTNQLIATNVPALLLLALTAVALRVGALLVPRSVSFDDGVYGASIVAMRHGLLPYRDLFSSQGPLYYPLLFVGDALGLHARNGPRIVPVLAGIVAPIAVWGSARRLGAGRGVALVAGLLVATTGSMLWTAGPATADGPAAAFTACAVYGALACRARPSLLRATFPGALLGAALATKPLMFPAIVPVLMWVGGRRRSAFVATAVVVWVATAVPWGLARVWDQSIEFHLDKGGPVAPLANATTVCRVLFERDLVLVSAVALGLTAAVLKVPARAGVKRANEWVISAWLMLVALVLVFERLLLVNHVATMVIPLALLFAVRPPPLRWLGIVAFVLAPVQALQLAPVVVPFGYRGSTERVVDTLESLPPRAQAVADVPGIVWQAGRTTPRLLNDPSNARIEAGDLTAGEIVAGLSPPETCAVVIWSFRFADLPGLRNALQRDRYTLVMNEGPARQLWRRVDCRP